MIRAWLTEPRVLEATRAAVPFEPTGYAGFWIQDTVDQDFGRRRIAPDMQAELPGAAAPQRVGEFLFRSMPERLRLRLKLRPEDLEERTPAPIAQLPPHTGKQNPQCGFARFPGTKSRWNDPEYIQNNRCYGYAANTFLERAIALPVGQYTWTPEELIAACREDEFLPVGYELPARCPPDRGHYVMACVAGAAATGFHFFRLDADGSWSHKAGDRPATTEDDTRRPILNLHDARFSERYTFAGFLSVGPEVRVRLCDRLFAFEGRCPDSDCRDPRCDAFVSGGADVLYRHPEVLDP